MNARGSRRQNTLVNLVMRFSGTASGRILVDGVGIRELSREPVLVQHAMAALRTDRTSFVIAHRLSTIRDAHTILVMENGHIVEHGSHGELLKRRGAYYELYMTQFQGGHDLEGKSAADVH